MSRTKPQVIIDLEEYQELLIRPRKDERTYTDTQFIEYLSTFTDMVMTTVERHIPSEALVHICESLHLKGIDLRLGANKSGRFWKFVVDNPVLTKILEIKE